MNIVKKTGTSATDQRRLTLHGSTPKRGMAKWSGQLQRLGEKPKGGRKP